MNVGFCIDDMPELYTSFLSDSIWSWVDTIVSSDGMTGEPGTNAGRVDFSNCKDLNKEPEGGGGDTGGYGVSEIIKHYTLLKSVECL